MGDAMEPPLSAEVVGIPFRNNRSGFTVLKLREPGLSEPFSARGVLPFEVREGDILNIVGHWESHPKFGRQFEFASAATHVPATTAGLTRYLATRGVRGLGPGWAGKIIAALGPDVLNRIAEDPNCLKRVKGLGPERRARLSECIHTAKAERDTLAALYSIGLGPKLCTTLIQEYGAAAATVVQRDPWMLAAKFHGVGFRTADEIAARSGYSPAAPQRLRAALLHALRAGEHQGHVGLPRESLVAAAVALTGVGTPAVASALHDSISSQAILSVSCGQTELIGRPENLQAETVVAQRIRQMVAAPRIAPVSFNTTGGVDLSDEQRDAVAMLLSSRCAVLTGGPGVGKTTVLRAVVDSFLAAGKQVALASPTGRAAKRLAEVTGQPATTLHRMFGLIPGLPSVVAGGVGQDADVLVIDEMSMVDLQLLRQVLEQLPQDATLLLVGDKDQLPPIGAGAPFADLIASGILPVARLTHVHRQAAGSELVESAHKVLRGEQLTFGDRTPRSDFFFMERDSSIDGAELISELFHSRLPARYGFNPRHDIQILTPMHAGPVGTHALNAMAQRGLNGLPPGEQTPRLQTGDRVMFTRNNRDLGTMNGDIGIIEMWDHRGQCACIRTEGQLLTIEGAALDDILPAYAVTVHKAQGAEYPAVILALFREHRVLLRRNLLYTAMTRARRLLVIVGERWALQQATADAREMQRHGMLTQRLQGLEVRLDQ